MGMRAAGKRLTPPKSQRESVVISLRLPTALVKQIDQIARRDLRSRTKVMEIAARAYAESKAA